MIDNSGEPDTPVIDPDADLAVLQYTGGTTGLPKGAMLTHSNLTCNVEQCLHWFVDAKPGQEKMLGVIPFFHVFAMTAVMNLSVRAGFEIVALPRFEMLDTLKLIHKHRPSYFPAVPAIYNAIVNSPHVAKYDLTSLKACVSGGAPLPVEVKKRFEEVTSCVVVEGYGLTETSPVACVNPLKGENRPGSIGLPLPATDIAILDKEDKQTPVEQGEPGELCITGPQVMKGYWRREEETAEVLREGRMHTGDVAEMDAEGYIYIVDRIKDMIITNGYNVYPRHVEEAIYLHPAVEECIVAGLPDDKRGERVKAWVKPTAGARLEAERLKGFLEDKISPIEMPREIEIRDEPLPKTLIGKLSRKDIVEQESGDSGNT
jgi:long-chain acyl-CoA synthetase